MSDGKIVIETDLDSTGIEKGVKQTEKTLKAQAASLAAEYRKQGMSASEAFKKAWSEIERTSENTSSSVDGHWNLSMGNVKNAVVAGMKVAAAAITASGTALSAVGAVAIKTGADFEAQMSRVKAISQATGEEFEQLRQQAIELGADTSFSAGEAAEGMESLAAAGFATNEIMEAMPGLLDLAAASGESLASSSDIAASALRGFGLDASEAAHVADVLAANANKTNSSVTDTGEAMKYVAPLARTAGISLEETAAAIGIMANAGIQGSQAGTTLRGALSRLSKPTDAMSSAMNELGISFYDSNGKMKSLTEQVGMLSTALEGMTDEQKNNYLVTLYGQEALSGMLTLINEGAGSLNELTTAYKNCDGSAKEAAATMQDNVKGAAEQLGGSLESLGIIIFESVSEELKDAAVAATESVDDISEAFKSGGIKSAVKEAGEIFDDFTESIAESNEELGGIIKPIKNVAKTGLDLGKKTLPVVADGFGLVARNLDVLVPLLTAGVVACKGYNVVMDAFVLKTRLAAAAQTAWNAVMNANPIGVVITALGALTAGIVAYNLVTEDAIESEIKLTEEQQKVLESCNEVTSAMEEARIAREKNVQTIDREYDGYESLVSELQSITDANGKVKAGYEERAKVITGLLSDALGTEITMTDGVIQKYQETISAIKELIVQKKAEALLSSMQSEMAAAYEKTTEALQAYKDAAAIVEEKDKAVETATKNLSKAQKNYNDAIENSSAAAAEYYGQIQTADAVLKEVQTEQEKARTEMNAAKTELSELSNEVNNYNELMEASATDEVARIEAAMSALVTSYKSYNEETLKTSEETRQAMYEQANSYAEDMKLVQDGTIEVADSIYQDMSSAALNSILEFNKVPGGVAAALEEIGPQSSNALANALSHADLSGKLDTEAKNGIESFIGGLSGLDAETQKVWSEAWYGALKGLEGFEKLADPAKEGVTAFLDSLIEALDVHSPSRAVQSIFVEVWPGAEEGLKEGQDSLAEIGKNVVEKFLNSLKDGELLSGAKGIGTEMMNLFGEGILSKETDSEAAGRTNAEAANTGAASIDPTGTGNAFGTGLSGGITAMRFVLRNAGNLIANSAKSGAGSINPYSTGDSFTRNYMSGINSVSTFGAGQGRANIAKSGVSSVSASGAGLNFVQGFINGFGFADVWSAAWNIGKRALSALRQAIKEGSPSKLTRKSGGFFGKGFELGILDEVAAVEKASMKLGNIALNGIDVSGLIQKARNVVNAEHFRFGKVITTNVEYKMNGGNGEHTFLSGGRNVNWDEWERRQRKLNKERDSRPIFLGTKRIDYPLPKGAVPQV